VQDIHQSVFRAPGVQVYGKVSIGESSSLWPNCVIRSEACEVRIGRMTNIQDFVMIHVGYEHPTLIGDFCSITHHATIHGATIGDCCLIGIGATIMDGAVIGEGSVVGAGAVVPEGKVFPPHSVIVGVPAALRAERDLSRENRLNAWKYRRNAEAYGRAEHRAWTGAEFAAWLAAVETQIESDADLAGDRE